MIDITRISELHEKDNGGEWDEWPYPTVTITSRVTGQLRDRILALLGLTDGEVLLEESEVSGGWSEFTQEDECSIRVLVDGQERWRHDSDYSSDNAMTAFTNWAGQ